MLQGRNGGRKRQQQQQQQPSPPLPFRVLIISYEWVTKLEVGVVQIVS